MTKEKIDHKFTVEWIALGNIKIHPKVQRPFRPKRARELETNFNENALGVLSVIRSRSPGCYWVFDGQHRHFVTLKMFGADCEVCCHLYDDMTVKQLADLTLLLNDSPRWSVIDNFKQRILKGEWQAITINRILHQHELRVDKNRAPGHLGSIAACDHVMKTMGGRITLEQTIQILHSAWGEHPDAYRGNLVQGIGLLCQRYNGAVDANVLSNCLAKSGGPGRFLGRARDYHIVNGKTLAQAVGAIAINEYNRGRRTSRVSDWK